MFIDDNKVSRMSRGHQRHSHKILLLKFSLYAFLANAKQYDLGNTNNPCSSCGRNVFSDKKSKTIYKRGAIIVRYCFKFLEVIGQLALVGRRTSGVGPPSLLSSTQYLYIHRILYHTLNIVLAVNLNIISECVEGIIL